jgi:hypothetical protein
VSDHGAGSSSDVLTFVIPAAGVSSNQSGVLLAPITVGGNRPVSPLSGIRISTMLSQPSVAAPSLGLGSPPGATSFGGVRATATASLDFAPWNSLRLDSSVGTGSGVGVVGTGASINDSGMRIASALSVPANPASTLKVTSPKQLTPITERSGRAAVRVGGTAPLLAAPVLRSPPPQQATSSSSSSDDTAVRVGAARLPSPSQVGAVGSAFPMPGTGSAITPAVDHRSALYRPTAQSKGQFYCY